MNIHEQSKQISNQMRRAFQRAHDFLVTFHNSRDIALGQGTSEEAKQSPQAS